MSQAKQGRGRPRELPSHASVKFAVDRADLDAAHELVAAFDRASVLGVKHNRVDVLRSALKRGLASLRRELSTRTPGEVATEHAQEIERVCSEGAYAWVVAEEPEPELSLVLTQQLGWDGTAPAVLAVRGAMAGRMAELWSEQHPEFFAEEPSRLRQHAVISVGGMTHFMRATNGRLTLVR